MHNFPSYHRDAPIGRTLLPWSTGIYLETQGDYTRACYHVDLNWEKTWLWVFFVFQSSFMLFFLLFLCSSFYLFLMNKHPRGKSGLAVLSLVKNFAEAVPAGAFCVVSHTERASGDECCWGEGGCTGCFIYKLEGFRRHQHKQSTLNFQLWNTAKPVKCRICRSIYMWSC